MVIGTPPTEASMQLSRKAVTGRAPPRVPRAKPRDIRRSARQVPEFRYPPHAGFRTAAQPPALCGREYGPSRVGPSRR